ncbi:MAG: nucleotidyltransferase domain-containing protein [Gammaproteobacteria bacterium]|nr:nucleotidyltransferase domain-containing protein [Gammaproteobacteria bacterium]
MRLTEAQVEVIRQTAAESFGAGARVWLFGSRVDDVATGGDIDLMIEAEPKPALRQTLKAQALLERRLGVPVDLIATAADAPPPIARIARLTGVRLS